MTKPILKIIKLIIEAIIEIIFPHFCVGCKKKDTLLCSSCYEQIEFSSFPFSNINQLKYVDNLIISVKYQNITAKLVHQLKYQSIIDLGKVIARLIYRSINFPDANLIIPVPIHRNKKNKRGFNQAEEIAKELSKLSGIPSINLLLKTRKTKSQMSINNRDNRKTNLKNSFGIDWTLIEKINTDDEFKKFNKNNKLNINKNTLKLNQKYLDTIILVDDVVTTGSTLEECAKMLKQIGVKKVVGVVLAQR